MMPTWFILFACFRAQAAAPSATTTDDEPASPQLATASAKTAADWTRELAGINVPTDLDAYIAKNPEVLSARSRPYGSVLISALAFGQEQIALALLRAGSEVPDHAIVLAARGGLDAFV